MFTTLVRIVWRFRWPVALSLLVLLVLFMVMQPKPEEEIQIQIPSLVNLDEDFSISPSGRYLFYVKPHSTTCYLFDLQFRKMVFAHEVTSVHSVGFDSNDGLVFSKYFWGGILQLNYWKPGTEKPELVGELKLEKRDSQFLNDVIHDEFIGIMPFRLSDDSYPGNRTHLLSPDGRYWLALRETEAGFVVDVIDTRHGRLQATLERLLIPKSKRNTASLEVAFSSNNQHLLVQQKLSPSNPEENYDLVRISRFDVRTGKVLSEDKAVREYCFGKVLYFDMQTIIALKQHQHIVCLQKHRVDKGYSLIPLSETLPENIEQSAAYDSNLIEPSNAILEKADLNRGIVTLIWKHELFPRNREHGLMAGHPTNTHGFRFSVRDVTSSKLIHSQVIPPVEGVHFAGMPEEWKLVEFLPDQFLLLNDPGKPMAPWQTEVDTWLQKNAAWFPDVFSGYRECLRVLDGKTGRYLDKLPLSLAKFHVPTQSLWLLKYMDDMAVFKRFAYPLRKPWLEILGWSGMVLIALICMQLLLRLRRKNYRLQPRSVKSG